jgi:hypothetical protein
MTNKKRGKRAAAAEDGVVLLKDLAPKADVTGGAFKLRFGESGDLKGQGNRESGGTGRKQR